MEAEANSGGCLAKRNRLEHVSSFGPGPVLDGESQKTLRSDPINYIILGVRFLFQTSRGLLRFPLSVPLLIPFVSFFVSSDFATLCGHMISSHSRSDIKKLRSRSSRLHDLFHRSLPVLVPVMT